MSGVWTRPNHGRHGLGTKEHVTSAVSITPDKISARTTKHAQYGPSLEPGLTLCPGPGGRHEGARRP
jgi:hypothetical protein